MIKVDIVIKGEEGTLDVEVEDMTEVEAGIFLLVLREAKKKILSALKEGNDND